MSGKRLMLDERGGLTPTDDAVPTLSIETNYHRVKFAVETIFSAAFVSVWDDGEISVDVPVSLTPSEAALLGRLLIQVADGGYGWARRVSA